MATVLAVEIKETSGFAATATAVVLTISPDDEYPHAASAEITAHASAQRNPPAAWPNARNLRMDFSPALRPTKFNLSLPEDQRAATAGHNTTALRHNLRSRIINRFFDVANLSRICGRVHNPRRHMTNRFPIRANTG
jgi:hypothetical protein